MKCPCDLRSAIALVAQNSGRAVADKLLTAFVPKAIGEGFEAGKEGDRFDGLKERFGAVAFLEVIVRDRRAQVMDVMKADVAGKPLQYFRQLVEGASLERSRAVIPIRTAFPMNVFELVLDVKEPHARRAGYADGNDLKDKISFPAEREAESNADEEYREVGAEDGALFARAGAGTDQALFEEENVERGETEQNHRVASEAVGKAFPARGFEVFLDG